VRGLRQRTLPAWEFAIEGAGGEGMIGVGAGLGGGGVRRRVGRLSELDVGVVCGFAWAAGLASVRLGFAHSGEDAADTPRYASGVK
jgi:hypothetical protein